MVKGLHVFDSYVTGHLPREHPQVAETTHDDRAEEGVSLGNDLTTPNFWMYSFRAKKVMMLSDPNHLDHILPFMQPGGVPYQIALTGAVIHVVHMPHDLLDPNPTNTTDFIMMADRAYSMKNTW